MGTQRRSWPRWLTPTAPILSSRRALQHVTLSRRLAGGPVLPVTFPTTLLPAKTFIALGADLSQPWYTWSWTDITDWVRYRSGISTSQGRPDESGTVRTSSAALTLDNRDGRFSRRNPTGPYYGLLTFNTPIWGTVDAGNGTVTRLAQYVNEWPTRWDKSGNDSTVPIACAGIMRRLAQGASVKSAMRATIAAANPTAWWTLEEGTDATRAASAIADGPRLTVAGTVAFGGTTTKPAGASAAVDFSGAGQLSGPTGIASGVATSWELETTVAFDEFPIHNLVGNRYTVLSVETPGSAVTQWGITLINDIFTPTTYNLGIVYNQGGIFASYDTAPGPMVVGQSYHCRISLSQSGGNIAFKVYVDGTQRVSSTTTGTLYAPTVITLNGELSGADPSADPVAMSHPAIWLPTRTTSTTYRAADGYAGEQAHARIIRRCGEEGVRLLCLSSVSAALGPQPVATFLDSLRDAESVDLGVLYEVEWGLGYQSLAERYNAAVALPLDFAAGHIAADPLPEPADDDQRLRNLWRAERPGGSEATAELTSGPLGTGTGGPGVYDDAVTVNVAADSQLPSQAGWRVHLGTVDEDRWPSIALHLHGVPSLIPTWTSLPFGARMQLANPPEQVAPDAIDAVIEGWTERWDPHTWDVVLTTSPYRPYEVNVVGASGNRGRVDAASSTLTSDVTSAATTLSVTSPGALWRTGTVNFDIGVGGERMTVTDIAPVVRDTFTRVVVDGWSTADTGQTWLNDIADIDLDVTGSVATITPTTLADGYNIWAEAGRADVTVRADFQLNALPASGTVRFGVGGRVVDGDNCYRADATISTAGAVTLTITRVSSATETAVGSVAVGTLATATSYTIEFEVRGSSLRARMWLASSATPNWLVNAVDTVLTAGTNASVYARNNTAVTTHVVTVDNFAADATVQTFTVTRSVNTVVKAQTAGTVVRLWKPGVYAL